MPNNDLTEIKDTLRELTDTLQSYILSDKSEDAEKKVIAQSVALSLGKLVESRPTIKQVSGAAEFITNFLQAIKGDKGDTGEQGIQGLKGDTGEQGIQGLKGDTGEQGIQGLKGDRGEKGDKGDQGEAGKDGKDGRDGVMGSVGKDGSPDTGTEIVKKLKSLPENDRLSMDDLKDVPDFQAMINRVRSGIKDPGITVESAGQEIASLINKINFTGSGVSVTKVGDRVLVQIAGGGGSAVQETPSGVIDGSNKVYTLSFAPVSGTLQLFINEALVSPSRFSVVGNQITFGTALDASYSGLPFDAFYEK